MADIITQTRELHIELKGEGDDEFNTRTLRIPNPDMGLTRAQIVEALKPALTARMTAASDSAIVPFFFDDADPTVGLTVLGETQIVVINKTVKPIV